MKPKSFDRLVLYDSFANLLRWYWCMRLWWAVPIISYLLLGVCCNRYYKFLLLHGYHNVYLTNMFLSHLSGSLFCFSDHNLLYELTVGWATDACFILICIRYPESCTCVIFCWSPSQKVLSCHFLRTLNPPPLCTNVFDWNHMLDFVVCMLNECSDQLIMSLLRLEKKSFFTSP